MYYYYDYNNYVHIKVITKIYMYTVTSECDLNLCENNGTCTRHVLTYTCECPDGFIGAFCQEKGMCIL